MLKLRSIFHKLKNLSLHIKVSVFMVFLLFFVFLFLSYSGQQVIFQQHGQERRLNKLNATKTLFKYELKNLNRVANTIVQDIPIKDNYNIEDFAHIRNHQQVLSKTYDIHIFAILDRNGNEIYSIDPFNAAGGYKSLSAVQKALTGLQAGGFEIINKDSMALVTSIPIKDEQGIKAVIVVGHIFHDNCSLLSLASKQYKANITLLTGKKPAAAGIFDKSYKVSKIDDKINNIIFKEKKPFYGMDQSGSKKYLTVIDPVFNAKGQVIGSLHIGIPRKPLDEIINAFRIRMSFLMIIVVVILILAMVWLHGQISIPLKALTKGSSQIASGDFNTRVLLGQPVRCWEILNCNKKECPAYRNEIIRCWFIGGDCCGSNTGEFIPNTPIPKCCGDCPVFMFNQGNEVQQLKDIFNYMAHSLEQREVMLKNAYSTLEEKNRDLENAIRQLESTENIVYTLALAVEAKDKYIKGHSERVAQYALMLAQKINLSEEEKHIIRNASLLHDVGKIGINERILNKTKKLTYAEYKHIQQHAALGEKICQPLRSANSLLPIIRHHHEWFNGNGYPDGLKGEEIPIGARILAIADAFDAMTTDRPYRQGLSKEKAIEILLDGAGIQWDRDLVKSFVEIIQNDTIIFKQTFLEDDGDIEDSLA